MSKVDVVFLWAEGILFSPVDKLVLSAMDKCTGQKPNLFQNPGYAFQKEQLALGRVSGREFCEAILRMFELQAPVETFEQGIINEIAEAEGVLDSLHAIHPHIQRWLVVDFPRAWFENAPVGKSAATRMEKEKILFTPELGLDTFYPDVFSVLSKAAEAEQEFCLILDANMKRSVLAVNSRMPSAIILNLARLQREFKMRKLVNEEYIMHQRPL